MKKAATPSFVVTLPLVAKGRDLAVMRQRFEAGKRLYNALLAEGLQRLGAMRRDPRWTALRAEPSGDGRQAGYRALREQYGFSEYALSSFATGLKNRLWKAQLGAHEPQTLAKRVFAAIDEHLRGQRGKPRFKGRRRPLHSLEGKGPTSGIRYQPETGVLRWGDRVLSVQIPATGRDPYLDEALARRVKFARVLWRVINGKTRYFAQLVLEGQAPVTAPRVDAVGGLDIGPSTVASVSPAGVSLETFCPGVQPCAQTLRRLQRQADRSLRATNPGCFDEAGRWIKGRKATVISRRLRRLRQRIAETERVLQARRGNEHGQMVNRLLAQANTWQLEQLSYRAFQKNFGRSVKNRAPGAFVAHLKRKAESAGGQVVELKTWRLKMSQYDHCTQRYTKKPLSLRWHSLGDGRGQVQRDLYSALLACCTDGNGHDPSRIETILAAQEPALKRAGWWRDEPARAKATAVAPASAGRAGGTLQRERTRSQQAQACNPA